MNAWCSITHKEEETIHCSWIIHNKMNFLYFSPSELLCNPTTFSSLLIFVTACCKKLWCTLSLRENTHVLSYPWPDYTLSPGFLRSLTDVALDRPLLGASWERRAMRYVVRRTHKPRHSTHHATLGRGAMGSYGVHDTSPPPLLIAPSWEPLAWERRAMRS